VTVSIPSQPYDMKYLIFAVSTVVTILQLHRNDDQWQTGLVSFVMDIVNKLWINYQEYPCRCAYTVVGAVDSVRMLN